MQNEVDCAYLLSILKAQIIQDDLRMEEEHDRREQERKYQQGK